MSKMRFISPKDQSPAQSKCEAKEKTKRKYKTQIEVRQEVASRLKTAREAAGYDTAEAFCKAHDLPAETYTLHENAKKAIRAYSIIQYAAHLNVDMQWIMLGEPWTHWKEEKEAKEQERGW